MEFREQSVLRFTLEVNDDVAAENHLDVLDGRPEGQQVVALEAHELFDFWYDRPQPGDLWEVSVTQRERRVDERRFCVEAALRFAEYFIIDVGSDYLDVAQSALGPRFRCMLVQQDRNGVRLLARCAAGAPHANPIWTGAPEL